MGAYTPVIECQASIYETFYHTRDVHVIGRRAEDNGIRLHQFSIESLHVILYGTLSFIHHALGTACTGLNLDLPHINKFIVTSG